MWARDGALVHTGETGVLRGRGNGTFSARAEDRSTLYLDAMKMLSSNAALTANSSGQGLDVETLPVKGGRMSLDVPFHRTNYLSMGLGVTKSAIVTSAWIASDKGISRYLFQ